MKKTVQLLTSAAFACAGPLGHAHAAALSAAVSQLTLQAPAASTVVLRDLAARPVHTDAAHVGAREMPRHLFPDGRASRAASALPVLDKANLDVVGVSPNLATPPASVSGFTGITDGSQLNAIGGELEPPDQGLAVNGGKVVEIVNNSLQVFDSTGKALSQPVSTTAFFNVTTGDNLSDPHAVYDPTTKRWYLEELQYGTAFNGFSVAVSKTSDPLGAYFVYHIDAGTKSIKACGGSCLPDYPQVGFDKNGFYIAADLFSNNSGSFVNAGLYALPKATLLTGKPFKFASFQVADFVIQPAIPAPGAPFVATAGGTEYLLSARNIFDGSTNIEVLALTNTAMLATKPTALKLLKADVNAEAYTATVPSTQPNVVGPYGKSVGATAAPSLDGGYNAFGGGVKYAAGHLYAALTSGATDSKGLARNVIAYFVLKPTVSATAVKATIVKQGYIVPPTGFSIFYPGMALDKSGNGIIGTTITSGNAKAVGGYPSTGFIEFQKNVPAGKYKVTGKGAASDDGFTGYGTGGVAQTGRWGDFASAFVDPTTGW